MRWRVWRGESEGGFSLRSGFMVDCFDGGCRDEPQTRKGAITSGRSGWLAAYLYVPFGVQWSLTCKIIYQH